jgi:sugar phosphate isomerase/epimerase
MPLDATLKAMVEIGLSYCEFFEGHAQPPKQETETWQQYAQRMREWRKTAPLDEFRRIRAQFNDAGIILWSLTHAPQPDETDEEIARSFEIAATLGVKYMFASSLVSMAKRLEPFAAKYKIPVAMHNHSNLRPDEMARPEDFAEALRGNPHIGINLDIGHFVAAGYDPVGFIEKHHARIYGLHIKDRKKNQGENFPLGEGDTPVKEVLQLLKTRKFAIPALIEYEYRGANTVDEVKRCYEYMKRVVA